MNVEKIIQKVLGKPEFKLDENIPISYIIMNGIVFCFGILRGFFRKNRLRKCGKRLFIGSKVRLKSKRKVTLGNYVRLENNVTLDALSKEGVRLGDRVKIGEYSKVLCTGSFANLGLGLEIGSNSSFAEHTFFGCAGGIVIGDDVISGQNVRFHSENHNFRDITSLIRLQGVTRKGIKVGNNVWIGSGAVLLDGTIIGDNCVIAAGAVLSGDFYSNTIIGGVPGKVIGDIT